MPLVTGPGNMQPVQIPDMVGDYSRVLALKQQMQNAPLQQQALQQQVQQGAQSLQQGQIEIQQKQRALQDQKAMDAAMQQWAQPKQPAAAGIPAAQGTQAAAGVPTAQAAAQPPAQPSYPDYDKLADLAQQNGASYDTVSKLRLHAVDMRAKATQIAMDDAKTGQDTANTMKTQNTARISALSGVANLSDEQLVPGLQAATQYLHDQGLLDEQHLPIYQQMLQSGDPATIRKQLGVQITSMGGFNQLLDDQQKKIENDQKQQTADWYKQHGIVPGVTVDEQQMASWLDQNKGKTPADYVKWKAQNSPSVIVQNMASNTGVNPNGATDWGKVSQKYGMTPQAFDQQAEQAGLGKFAPIGRGANGVALNRALMSRYAELHPGASIAENSAEFKANTDSLKKLQGSFDALTAFENTANKNIDMLKGYASKVPDLGVKFANVPVRMLTGNMIGTENMAAFKTALAPVQTEAAKILNSANLQGQLSDSSRHELQDLVDGNMPYKSLVASLNVLQQDFKNRHDTMQDQIGFIQARLRGGGGQGSTGNSGGAAAGDPFSQFGGKAH